MGGFRAFPKQIIFFKKMISKSYFYTLRSSQREVFCKKGALRNLAKFTGKHLWQSLSATLLKKRLWRRCFPVNFAKFLRTLFLIEHLRWLLLTLEFLKIVLRVVLTPITLANPFKLLKAIQHIRLKCKKRVISQKIFSF